MASLSDVLGTPRTVEVRGKAIPVNGVQLEFIPVLYRRFPDEIRRLGEMTSFDTELLMTVLPALVAPVIAAGLGHPGDEREEAVVRRLNFMEQARLLRAIWEETAPDGLDPLMDEVRALVEQMGAGATAASSTAPAVNGAVPKKSSKASRSLSSN